MFPFESHTPIFYRWSVLDDRFGIMCNEMDFWRSAGRIMFDHERVEIANETLEIASPRSSLRISKDLAHDLSQRFVDFERRQLVEYVDKYERQKTEKAQSLTRAANNLPLCEVFFLDGWRTVALVMRTIVEGGRSLFDLAISEEGQCLSQQ
jgi:hypothetical protein